MSLFGTGAAFLLTAPAPVHAAGFYLQEQSVRGWGRANSGEAADQGPASLWWNPASIGGTEESSGSFGATIFLPTGELSDQGTTIDRPIVPPAPVGGVSLIEDPIQRGVAPNNAMALRLSNRLALGLAITSPFSFTSDYDPGGWQRYSAIHTRLTTIDIQPSVAVMATPWLSLGAGVNVEYADASLSNALPNLAPGSPDARLRLKGHGWDLGWSAGLQLRPSKTVTIGLAYKSAVEHKLDGSVEISGLLGPLALRNMEADTVARFSTPWQLIIGARGAVSKTLTLNAQAVRFGWSKFDRISLAAPLNSAIAQDYKDTWSVAFGVDDRLSERLTLRAGIQIDPTPTRDAARDPRVPDADRIDYNVGASFLVGKKLTLDAAAALTDFETVAINREEHFYTGTAAQTDVVTAGRAGKQRAIVIALGGRMRF
jgi:long-chain fatty acid transport protein